MVKEKTKDKPIVEEIYKPLMMKSSSLLWKYETDGTVLSVAISSNGEHIVVGSADHHVYFFNRKGKLLWRRNIGSLVKSVAISSNGEHIVVGDYGGRIYFFNREGKLLWKYEISEKYNVASIAISSDGKYIAVGDYSGRIHFFNREGRLLWKYEIAEAITSIAISSDGEYIVVGDCEGRVHFLNKEGRLLWKYETTGASVLVAISSSGEYIAAGNTYRIHLFNREGKLLGNPWNIELAPLSVAISSNGEYIIIGSADRHVYFFNREGKLLWKYETTGAVWSVAISSNGEYIAIGDGVGQVYLFASPHLMLKIMNIVDEVRSTISQMKSKYGVEEVESLLLQAEQAFSRGDFSEAWKLALRARQKAFEVKRKVEELKAKIEELELKARLVSGLGKLRLGKLLENARKEFERGNYDSSLSYINRCKEMIEKAKPKLRIEFLDNKFTLNMWKKVEVNVINEGDAIAKNIEFVFSDDVSVRNIPKIDVEPKSRKRVEFYIKPNVLGEVPVEVEIRCRDHLNREYVFRQSIIFEVKERIEEVAPVRGVSPKELTPKLVIPKTFPSELLDRYVEVEYIGSGGFARVFKAKRRKDGKVVAVKIPISLDEATGRSFLREIENWAKLDHKNIVKVYDYNILPIPYIEMELCDQSLADLPKPIEVKKAAWIIFNIAEGLKYAHAKKIIHRDLKPQNILLKNGIPKISDWGLSKVMTESSSSSRTSFTPFYAAPEQIKGESKDERTDIWQLGVIFYELVTGELPFKGDDPIEVAMAILTKQPIKPSEINPEAKDVEHIIMKCLEKDKNKRYQSVKELQKDLAKYLGIKYRESLDLSITRGDLKRSAYYCCELLLINMKINNINDAYKYALDLLRYTEGEVREQVQELCEELRARIKYGLKDISEELIRKAEIIAHRVRMELFE